MLLGKLRWSVIWLALVLIGGTIGYRIVEGWPWLDCAWMVLTTMTTIGFGEVHPLSDLGRIYTMGLIISGVGLVTFTATQVTRWVIDGELAAQIQARRRRRTMNRLQGHFIVVGLGRLGHEVAEELSHRGRVVVGIDPEPHAGEDLSRLLAMRLEQDGTADDVLREAAIERARGLAAATGSDATNIFITLSARQMNPNLHIITRVDEATSVQKAIRAGASAVVNPYGISGARMAQGLVSPHAAQLVDQAVGRNHSELEIEDVEIGDDPSYHGTLGALNIPERHRILIVAIRRPDGHLMTSLDRTTELSAGDIAVVVGKPSELREFALAASSNRSTVPRPS
ncbi:MAG: potassium channel protein [Deltaproteobacteria bacterium]|jgi:voltage-gated potassium channel